MVVVLVLLSQYMQHKDVTPQIALKSREFSPQVGRDNAVGRSYLYLYPPLLLFLSQQNQHPGVVGVGQDAVVVALWDVS